MRITFRVWLNTVAVVASVLCMVWYAQIVLMPAAYYHDTVSDLGSYADTITQILESENLYEISDTALIELSLLDQYGELRVELFGTDGSALYFGGWGPSFTVLQPGELERTLSGEELSKNFTRTSYGDVLMNAYPLYRNDAPVAALTVCVPIAPIEDTLGLLSRQMLIITLLSLLVTMLISFLLARVLVKPVREMKKATLAIAEGEYGRHIGSKDTTELGDLSRAIDDMSQKLAQTEEIRREFIATVSHQFKTPLAIIQGNTELLADTLPPEYGERKEFATILDEVSRLDNMARDMLKLAAWQAGSQELSVRHFDVAACCRSLRDKLSILGGGIELSVNAPERLEALGDEDQIRSAVENITQNAIIHSGAGRICIKAVRTDAGRVRVEISDNGHGMSSEQLEHIWERFYKADSKDRRGSGLGMAIVRAILEAHNAPHGAYNNNGVTVWFELNC